MRQKKTKNLGNIKHSKLFMIIALFISLVTTGCANPVKFTQTVFPKLNPPEYMFNSGILKLKHKLQMPLRNDIDFLLFSNNGRYLVTCGKRSRYLYIWDMETGKILHKIKRLVHLDKGPYRIEGKSGTEALFFYDTAFFSKDDRTLWLKTGILGLRGKSRKTLKSLGRARTKFGYLLVNMDNGSISERTVSRDKHYRIEARSRAQFSKDGKYAAGRRSTRCYNNNPDYGKCDLLLLYDPKDFSVISRMGKGYGSSKVLFTPDSKYLVDYERVLTDDSPPPKWKTVDAPPGSTSGKIFWRPVKEAPVDSELAREYLSPEIRFWSIPDLKLVKTIDNVFYKALPTDHMALSPDGKYVAVTGHLRKIKEYLEEKKDNSPAAGIKIFRVSDGQLVYEIPNTLGPLFFSQKNKYLTVLNWQEHMAIRIYSTKDWQKKEQVQFLDRPGKSRGVFNPAKNLLAFSKHRLVYVWEYVE